MFSTKTGYIPGVRFYGAMLGLLLATTLVTAGPSYNLISMHKPPVREEPAPMSVNPQAKPVQAMKYIITLTTLPDKARATVEVFYNTPDRGNRVLLQAHVPEKARIWFEEQLTSNTGEARLFVSPPLALGHRYTYRIHAQWWEGNRPVDQVRTITVQPGDRINLDFGH